MKNRKFIVIVFFLIASVFAQVKKPITFTDVMKFKQIERTTISEFGNWVAVTANPDRGDGELKIISSNGKKEFTIPRGQSAVFSTDEDWAAIKQVPEFKKRETSKIKSKLFNNLVLLNTRTGEKAVYKNVKSFEFSNDANWIVIHYNPKKSKKKSASPNGSKLELIKLTADKTESYDFVNFFRIDSAATKVFIAFSDSTGKTNGLFVKRLDNENESLVLIDSTKNAKYSSIKVNKNDITAFLKSKFVKKKKNTDAEILIWNGIKIIKRITSTEITENWRIPFINKLEWNDNLTGLYFGINPKKSEKKKNISKDLFDLDAIVAKRELDVWHWNDPYIKPNEKKLYSRLQNKTYKSIFYLNENKFIQLADLNMPDVITNKNMKYAVGISDVKYLKEITWDGRYYDLYVVNLNNGKRKKIFEHLNSYPRLSPNGKYIAYYNDREWYLYDIKNSKTKNLTKRISVKFENEDHDYPSAPPGYGIAGWTENDEDILIYDKYDIWKFNTSNLKAENVTGGYGRKKGYSFRIIKLGFKKNYLKTNKKYLLSAYNEKSKQTAIYKFEIGKAKVQRVLEKAAKYTIIAKAKKVDKYLYTVQKFSLYPDVWVASSNLNDAIKLTNYGEQIKKFKWGRTELVHWRSADGIPLDGVIIKPEDFKKGKKYPVLVYYYRFYSQRLFDFPDVVLNHRPNFPMFVGNDYIVFMPDIRFEVGRPGISAVKCLVPGVQKLIDMGIADPKAIGLHGHSWSGYQTTFVITQTNIFACALAGAPVTNMTSAYGGVRWATGKSRQYQYEKTQSRIGGTLWEKPMLYLENSPLFYADRIQTPLIMLHGDVDGAVPWYQSIEMYMAMRRLGKNVIFLQYHNEPHHLKKYPNKLDYSIKMFQIFDYYLKGKPAPDWILKGEPFYK